MTKWEYMFHEFYGGVDDKKRTPLFAGFGAEGWELVCISPQGTYIFKRRIMPDLRDMLIGGVNEGDNPEDAIATVESVPIYPHGGTAPGIGPEVPKKKR